MSISRFIIVGGGSIGKRHINNLISMGYKNIACLHYSLSSKIDDSNVVDLYDWDELKNYDPCAVIICSPTHTHLDILNKINDINFHIFMEKPLTSNNVEIKGLVFDKNVFMIGFMLRYHSQIIKIKHIINKNIYGNIIRADFEFGSYLPNWHPDSDYKNSYVSNKEMGGGVINTISHEVDLICWFFGFPKTVYTQFSDSNFLCIDVEESCDSIFGYEKFNVSLHLDLLQKTYNRSIRIYFEEAVLEWNWNPNTIILNPYDKKKIKIHAKKKFDVNNLYYDELTDFINNCNINKVKNNLDLSYAKKNQELLNLMHTSNSERRRLDFRNNES